MLPINDITDRYLADIADSETSTLEQFNNILQTILYIMIVAVVGYGAYHFFIKKGK
jgi:hypothetical protein